MNYYSLKNTLLWIPIIVLCGTLNAQNPISPPGVYLADPSARSWDGSTLYLYTSTDTSPDCQYWCSWEHDVLYTNDLKTWEIAPKTFASKGENDQVGYNDQLLFAPDCVKKDDSYILYYCQPDKDNALGTAISNSPTGPFIDGQLLNTGKKYSQIDPAVFIDDDGTAYVVWGQANMKMAVLEPNMRKIDTTTIKDKVLTTSEHFFHEGPYMTKRNGIYYLIFADESRKGTPSCLGYATSKNPFGPYKYGGVIIDNAGCNPGNWNNHGSIIKFKNQWYVFYHRSTHGCAMFRKSCVEKIYFNSDNSISEVEMTSQGTLTSLDASNKIEAETACIMQGNVRIEKEGDFNEKLSKIENGDQASFKYLNFVKGLSQVTIRYKAFKNCKLSLYVSKDKQVKKISEIELIPSDEPIWLEKTFKVKQTEGVVELILEGVGNEGFLFEIDWFKFSK